MAFSGTDIALAGVDGPFSVHARLSLGGWPYLTARPIPDPNYVFIEWNYTTRTYLASEFDPPVRPAYFTGGPTLWRRRPHSDVPRALPRPRGRRPAQLP